MRCVLGEAQTAAGGEQENIGPMKSKDHLPSPTWIQNVALCTKDESAIQNIISQPNNLERKKF